MLPQGSIEDAPLGCVEVAGEQPSMPLDTNVGRSDGPTPKHVMEQQVIIRWDDLALKRLVQKGA